MTGDVLEHASIHEACHFVTAVAKGYRINFCELLPPNGGVTNIEENEDEMDGDTTIYFAGHAGEKRWFGSHLVDPESSPDYAAAARVGGSDYRRWKPEAEALVDDHSDAVEYVAEELKQHGRLDGDHLQEVIQKVRGLLAPKAMHAGQNMNTGEALALQSGPLSEESVTQPEVRNLTLLTQPEDEEEQSNVVEKARLSEPEEPEIFTQSPRLSEPLSTQSDPKDRLSEDDAVALPQRKAEFQVTETEEDAAKLSTQSEGPLSTQPGRKLSTQSWAPLSTQPAAKLALATPRLSEESDTQPSELSEPLSTQPHPLKVVNLADFRTQSHPVTALEYNGSTHKRSRVKPGHLIVRIDGYSIAEDEYGLCYLKVLSRKPDRTSADFTKYPYAGFFKWTVAEEMGMLVKEISHGARSKSGSGRGKRRAGNDA